MRVAVQQWEESEKGWGTRPDGYSLHMDMWQLQRFIKDYWDSMPDYAPDEYSRPVGDPFWIELDEAETEEHKVNLLKAENGIRTYTWKP